MKTWSSQNLAFFSERTVFRTGAGVLQELAWKLTIAFFVQTHLVHTSYVPLHTMSIKGQASRSYRCNSSTSAILWNTRSDKNSTS